MVKTLVLRKLSEFDVLRGISVLKKTIIIIFSYMFIQLGAFAASQSTTISIDAGRGEQDDTNSMLILIRTVYLS